MSSIAVDPVCGMNVAVTEATITAEVDGQSYYFCASGCRKAFLKDPASFLAGKGEESHGCGCGHCGHH